MRKPQLIALSVALLLCAALFVMGRSVPRLGEGKQSMRPGAATGKGAVSQVNIDTLLARARMQAPAQVRLALDSLQPKADAAGKGNKPKAIKARAEAFQAVAFAYESINAWDASAIYEQRAAKTLDTSAAAWAVAGNKFLAAFDLAGSENAAEDSANKAFFASEAVASLKRATELAPNNLDIKADYGNALVLGSSANPMQGIQVLNSITAQDPNHLRANYHLGRLAIVSGQYQKAADRFRKLTQVHRNYPEAFLGLGEALYNLGKSQEAIAALERYKALVRDPRLTSSIDGFIEQIRQEAAGKASNAPAPVEHDHDGDGKPDADHQH